MRTAISPQLPHPIPERIDAAARSRQSARLLHPSSPYRPLTPAALLIVAEDLAAAVDRAGLDVACDGGRDFRRVLRSERLEAWLIAWGPSTFLGLHDHGGSNGAFRVLSGVLAESETDTRTRAPLRTSSLSAGAQRAFGATHVHEVWNPAREAAVSLHVYSPPLSHMNFFGDSAADYLVLQRTERVDGCPEAAGGAEAAWAERATDVGRARLTKG